MASFDIHGPTSDDALGVDHKSKTDLNANSVFRVASLTKPVFAYLVLKLIEDNKSGKAEPEAGEFHLPDNLKEFTLDTPLYKITPEILDRFVGDDIAKAKKLTPRFILSHQTGLPINQRADTLKFEFEPGTEYGYSNPGILLLQEVIEKLTEKNLETLAKANVFDPLHMTHSSFGSEYELVLMPKEVKPEKGRFYVAMNNGALEYTAINPLGVVKGKIEKEQLAAILGQAMPDILQPLNIDKLRPFLPKILDATSMSMSAANSLHTTPNDYARFVAGWLNDDRLRDAFISKVSIMNDRWAAGQGLSDEDRKKVAWGLGIGLQIDSHGKSTRAFHSGDMNEWRAFVAIDLADKNKKGIVYFANSKNGLMLADDIISPNVELDDGLKYVFQKFGFARKIEPDWQKNEVRRVVDIIETYELHNKDVSDQEMARSSFGQSSNTARMRTEHQTYTHVAKKLGVTPSPSVKPLDKTKSDTQPKKEMPAPDRAAASESTHIPKTPFRTKPKPRGGHT